MNVIMTMWRPAGRGAHPGPCNWPSVAHHARAWRVSTALARAFAERVVIYCDASSARWLERIGVEAELRAELDVLYDRLPNDALTLGKIYSQQRWMEDEGTPYLHIDSDAFFWEPPRLGEGVTVHCLEPMKRHGYLVFYHVYRQIPTAKRAPWLAKYIPLVPAHGVVGTTDLEPMHAWAVAALREVEEGRVPPVPVSRACGFLEQYSHGAYFEHVLDRRVEEFHTIVPDHNAALRIGAPYQHPVGKRFKAHEGLAADLEKRARERGIDVVLDDLAERTA